MFNPNDAFVKSVTKAGVEEKKDNRGIQNPKHENPYLHISKAPSDDATPPIHSTPKEGKSLPHYFQPQERKSPDSASIGPKTHV